MTRLSGRAGQLPASMTLSISTRAKAIAAGGEKVFRFGVGEPDFDTPEHIKEAARRALEGRIGGYTPVAGTPELREAVAASYTESGVPAEAAGVVVTVGAKQALFHALAVLVQEGDEVVLPAPYWVSYPSMVQATGADAVMVDTRPDGCVLTPERLEAALTPRTRALVFVSPGNPTGVTHTHEQIVALGEVLKRHPDVVVISDEIYQHLVYGETTFTAFAAACPALAERTVSVRGVSKSFAMTGWRIGYATGPGAIIGAMTRLQSHTTSNATAIAQAAALAALTGPMEPIRKMRDAFDRRRILMTRLLSEIDGFTLFPPTGAFYCFPDIAPRLNKKTGTTPLAFSEGLLDKERVACVPGEAFGAATNIRLSYACSEDAIEEGCARIRRYSAKC